MIGVRNKIDSVFIYWENHLLGKDFWSLDSAGITVNIPRKAREFDRSYIRAWAYNKAGISNEILVPLQNGKVLSDPVKLSRTDRESMIMYFLMVDRFRNGDKEIDQPVKDPEIDPKVNYMGGDIAGITRTIEDGYFSNLGVNTLWISPITQNPLLGFVEYPAPHRKFSGYHGYWPITLTTIDNRFGDSKALNKMVMEAHGKGMNVILDFVSHHVHQDYPLLKAHPDWITSVDLPGKKKNIRLFDEQRLTTWFDIFLPTFDLTKPEVAEMVSDSATFWIREYKIDGFRHDAAKHVPESYWRLLNQKLNKEVTVPEGRGVYQIGETFGSRELIASYINPGMLDAQFEFNLYWDAKNSFASDNTSFRELNYSLQQRFNYFGEHNLMGNITGNQDYGFSSLHGPDWGKQSDADGNATFSTRTPWVRKAHYCFNVTIRSLPPLIRRLIGSCAHHNRQEEKSQLNSRESTERSVKLAHSQWEPGPGLWRFSNTESQRPDFCIYALLFRQGRYRDFQQRAYK